MNLSKAPGCQDEYIDIRSDYANGVNMSLGGINASQDEAIIQISNLQLDENAQDSYQII